MKFLLLSLSISFWIRCNGHPCGPAGYFEDQRLIYWNSSSGYSKVHYECLFFPGSLIGNSVRKCQISGTWDGNIPICLQPVKDFVRNVSQSSKDPFERDDINVTTCLTDNNKQSRCILLPGDQARYVNVTFQQSYRVVAVVLAVHLRHEATINLFWNLTSLEGATCYRDQKYIDYYKCPNPVEANFMIVNFSSISSVRVILFELNILEEKDAPNCSIPDTPAYGSYEFDDNRTVVYYKCDERYVIIGNDTSNCLPNGTWTEPAPVCHVELCHDQLNVTVENGEWVKGNRTSLNDTSMVLSFELECDSGFEIDGGPTTIRCLGNNTWSSTNATCVMTEKSTTNQIFSDDEERLRNKLKDDSIHYTEGTMATTLKPTNDLETFHPETSKHIAVGIVSGFVSAILVMVGVFCIVFGRKKCNSQARVTDNRRDSSYYHYYNGINYEEIDRVTLSSTSTSISVANRPPAKDPRVPDILELVYENPSLYDQNSRNASAVETEFSECSRHIYSEVDDGRIYDEPNRNSNSHRESGDSEVFRDNDIYDEDP